MKKQSDQKVIFYPISLDYIIENKKPIIRIFSVLENGNKCVMLDDSFRPYFYAEINNMDIVELKKEINKIILSMRDNEQNMSDLILEDVMLTEKKHGHEKKELFKIRVNIPKAIPILSKHLLELKQTKNIFEKDIKFIDKYLMDMKIKLMLETEATITKEKIIGGANKLNNTKFFYIEEISQKTKTADNLRILAFDIETYSPKKGIMNPDRYPILMISLYGDFGNKIYKKVLTWKKFNSNKGYIEYCKTEKEMIERFNKILKQIDPIILTGYFSSGFDFPYLLTRAKKYKIHMDFATDGSLIKQRKGKNRENFIIKGIEHIDALKFVRRMLSSKMETNKYDLGSVSNEFFGEGKYEIDIEKLHKYWDSHIINGIDNSEKLEEYVEYNLKDSELTYRLCKKIVPTLIEFSKLTNVSIQDANELGFSQLVEHYLMNGSSKKDILIPEKPHNKDLKNRLNRSYEGAFVYKPTPGLYENIILLDFKSMYPTIISSHNISPETFDAECPEQDKFYLPIQKNAELKSSKKHWFCQNEKGLIAGMIEELIDRRTQVKKIIKNTKKHIEEEKDEQKLKELKNELVLLEGRQEAMKLLSNSITGYLGFYGSRWYSLECISNVLLLEREYIKKVISEANKRKLKVIYSDTDSIFIAFGKDNKNKDYKKEGMLFSQYINSILPEKMDLEFEGYFQKGIFVASKESEKGAKKKYALLDENKNLVIKGFEAVRSNWSPISKKVQVNVIRMLLEGNKEKAIEYIKEVLTSLKNKKIPPEELVISTRITKPLEDYASISPHVAVAMKLEKKGINISPGMSVEYIIIEKRDKKERIGDRAEPYEEGKEYNYDYEYYANNQIIPAIDSLIRVFGYSKEDLEKKEQSNLSGWFAKS